ncbi:MAG: polyribonucleotide nucleotidyltransferase [Candidatus Omnitrophica bacterium]|nr:polyribonucleotide nucleotidyltransferase [Candidatus Omnitrophota bacterium]
MNSFSITIDQIGSTPLTFSSGLYARQANGSVIVSYGDTMVLVTVCAAKQPSTAGGFLPLMVEYQEKPYSMGKIPGGYIKKEGRPKDREILSARVIDRTIRPLFPKGFINEVQVIAMVLSSDRTNIPDVLAINGAACALCISDIPFENLLGAVRVARIGGKLIINPTYEQRDSSDIDFIICATREAVVMLEGEFEEFSEDEIIEAIKYAHPFIIRIIEAQEKFRAEGAGKEKGNYPLYTPNEAVEKAVRESVTPHLEKLFKIADRDQRHEETKTLLDGIFGELTEKREMETTLDEIKSYYYEIEGEFVRKKILEENTRPDGRQLNEIRPIDCKVGVLPRTHGSAVFTRGQTQALATITLGTAGDEQMLETLEGEKSKHFMLHYLFPPFSVGEVKFMRGPSRRELGHGALAEKAVTRMIPSKEEFPYTIRIVSEILESNGSSSMATVCASSLSLMDAGIPVRKPVAGIAMGLVSGKKGFRVLTDIAGAEDHHGDMDFKVAGTDKGVTAVQVDIKITGLSYDIIKEAFSRAKEARLSILEKMNAALSAPRTEMSRYAPKIRSIEIPIDKIGVVIGPGGKMIRQLTRDYNVNIDIDDAGIVSIVAESAEDLERAAKHIIGLTREVEIGEVFDAKVVKIVPFGAFCDILPGKSGLIHVSEITDEYVKDVNDFLKLGDVVKAKVIKIDPQGKITLSMKQV